MRGRNGLKWKFSLQTISGLTCKERERSHAERSHLEPFDFAPFDFAIRLQLWIAPRSHRERLSENPEPFNIAIRLRLRIAPRSHRERSLANPEPRALRLRTLQLRRSTLTSNRTQIAPFDFAGEPRAQIWPDLMNFFFC